MLARVPATWLPGLRQLLESRGGVAKWWHRVQSTMDEELGDLWGEVEGVEGAIQARADAIVQAELDAWNALDAEERRDRPLPWRPHIILLLVCFLQLILALAARSFARVFSSAC